jgi:hypothetical protein
MQAKVGDKVALDGRKLGQPRRTGVIRRVTKGLSGVRYQIAWDDGHESVIAPGAGNLTVEGRTTGNSRRKRNAKARTGTKAKAKSKAKPAKKAKKGKKGKARKSR